MASLPTGSDELVCVRTELVSLTMRGPAWHPSTQGVVYPEKVATFTAFCAAYCDLCFSGEAELDWKRSIGKAHRCAYRTAPQFYEGQPYAVEVEVQLWRMEQETAEEAVSLWQERDGHRTQVAVTSQSKKMLSGTLHLDHTVGPSVLVLCVDGRDYLHLTFEVFPARISYQADYAAIYAELSDAVCRAAWRALMRQLPDHARPEPLGNGFYALFEALCSLCGEFRQTADRFLRHPGQGPILRQISGGIPAAGRRARLAELTRQLVRAVVNGLLRVRRTCLRAHHRPGGLVPGLSAMIQGLLPLCGSPWGLRASEAVFALPPGAAQPAALHTEGRALCRDGKRLLQGLSVIDGLLSLSVSQLVSLYPYWCFARLQRLIEAEPDYRLTAQERLLTGDSVEPSLPLLRGDAVRVQYQNQSTRETLTLTYRPGSVQAAAGKTAVWPAALTTEPEQGTPLEHGLYLELGGVAAPRRCVFDAQYHFNPAVPGTTYYHRVCSLPGPEREDIRAIYRYREDTVRQTGQPGQAGFGAYVLFPYEEEQVYCSHRFYRSIGKTNVGGVPFLPLATALTAALLRRFLMLGTVPAQLPLPAPVEEALEQVNWSVQDVLIGTLGSVQQLQVALEARFYHIPAARLEEADFPIRYIAIYQSRNLFGKEAGVQYYGQVRQHTLVRRGDITELPPRPNTENERYYRFEIKEWKKLEKPIAVKEMRFVTGFTNLFLLTTAAELPELWLRTGEAYRLYRALLAAIRDSASGEEEKSVSFPFAAFLFTVEGKQILVTQGGEHVARYSVSEFSRSPNAVLERMQAELIDGTRRPTRGFQM